MSPASADQAATYRIELQYCGAPYHGWQSQPSGTGVQDHLERALGTVLRHPVRVIGGARTDSGVHAEHQVVVFKTPVAFESLRWLKSLNGILPETIGVTEIRPEDPSFHPISSATAKAYRYRLWRGAARNPHVAPYVWALHRDLDVDAMRQAAADFIGTHDFTSFCAADSSAKTRERTVSEILVTEHGPMVEVWVLGPGFLKQMVRIMVGTLVDVGLGKRPVNDVPRLIAARDRRVASATAPAQGLSLVRIFYEEKPRLVSELRQELASGFCHRIL